MKKLIYGITLLSTLGLAMFSCEKESLIEKAEQETKQKSIGLDSKNIEFIDQNDYSKLRIENNVLEFESIDYYESFLSRETEHREEFLIKKLKDLNFKSFSEKVKSQEDDIDFFVKSILDENGIVKIGKWFIKLNFSNEKVYACSDEKKDAYDLTLREDKISGFVYEFTFDDEVLVLLADEANLNNKAWFKRCKDRVANKHSVSTLYHQIMNYNGTYIDAKIKAEYVGWGISFKLRAVGEIKSNDSQMENKATMWFYLSNCSYKVRCSYNVSNYTYPTNYPTGISKYGNYIIGYYNFYSGIQRLKNYNYKVRLRIDHTYYVMPPNNFADDYSNYVQIQDY